MIIHFLNVGQGDSLVLTWLFEGKKRYAIIDCKKHRKDGAVPTIKFLEDNAVKEIEFIILSHPHTDHFSGLIKLFHFTKKNNITVKNLFHTCLLDPNKIRTVVNGPIYKLEVARLFSLIDKLEKEDNVEIGFLSESDAEFKINDEWGFKVLSPSVKEYNDFTRSVQLNYIDQDEDFENETYANLVSTIFVFYTVEGFFLLTSDSLANSHFRIDKRTKRFLGNKKFLFGQIAHHGSEKNYNFQFWRLKANQTDSPIAVISVGTNKYGHPSPNVVNDLRKLGYNVKATNELFVSQTAFDTENLLDIIADDESGNNTQSGIEEHSRGGAIVSIEIKNNIAYFI